MLILDGRKVRDEIAKALREKIAAFSSAPTLAIVQVGARPESDAYIGRKKKFGETIGARVEHIRVSEGAGVDEIRAVIEKLDRDAAVHGIILQLPVPSRFNRQRLIDAIAPEKDADGLTTEQVNARKAGRADAVIPATARGVIELLESYQIPIRGKRAAVLGRSALVGAPAAEALRQRGAEVAVCHSQTANTKDITRASDIIVVAIGKPRLVGREYFKDDNTQTVVDVGITAVTEKGTERLEEEILNDELVGLDRPGGAVGRTNLKRFVIGDVDFDAVRDMVAAISPVPGGVGPMTVAALFENLVDSML